MGLREWDSFNNPLMYNTGASTFTDLAHLRRYSDSVTPTLRLMAGSETPETSPPLGATKPEDGEHSGCCTPEQPQKARQARRRTKTGCLTCRKRRIKCGEERPICKNCIKSKRHCEGYNQRVIFKTPTTDFRYGPQYQTTMAFHTGSMPASHSGFSQPMMPTITQDATFAPLQPRLGDNAGLGIATSGTTTDVFFNSYNPQSSVYQTTSSSPSGMLEVTAGPVRPGHPRRAASWQGQNAYISPQPDYHSQPWSTPERRMSSHTPPQSTEARIPSLPSTGMWPPTPVTSSQSQFPSSGSYNMYTQTPGSVSSAFGHSNYAATAPHGKGVQSFPNDHPSGRPEAFENLFDGNGAWSGTLSLTEMLQLAATEIEDDDYYDLEPEDNEILSGAITFSNSSTIREEGSPQDLGALYSVHRANLDDLSVRDYNTFLFAGVLDDYRPERVANPLRNPRTARVFAHFIHATGPSLSSGQRFGRAASLAISDAALPRSQQGLWTYTLPVMALHNQGLLHAMLALSSLHIAKLQGADTTPSMKHYAYSLKRVHKSVGSPIASKRHDIATIAATLLLGFYEIWAAEHMKWSSHLAGAKQLFVELDFPGMTMELRRRKMERQAFDKISGMAGQGLWSPIFEQPAEVPDIDDSIVAAFAGMHPRYDDYGRVEEMGQRDWRSGRYLPVPLELSTYEIYQDLYWWYCKQDIYHSIVSGEPLLMDWSRWTDCPPRAPLNQFDSIHGSFDHVVLLLARVADFAARDRTRKLRAVAANNGIWRPGLFGNVLPPPETAQTRASAPTHPIPTPSPGTAHTTQPGYSQPGHTGSGPARPPNIELDPRTPGLKPPAPPPSVGFYGMAPSAGPTRMPSRYEPPTTGAGTPSSSTSSAPTAADLTAQTAAAEREWHEIHNILCSFPSFLGPAFNALTTEFTPPVPSPFGPAAAYASYDINCLRALYHMALIVHFRAHPSMPAASMIAAGVAAPHTAYHAIAIGRLAAGVQPTPLGMPLNPSLGAAMIETCVPLFFAGIQIQDPAQRAWLVSYVRDIEKRTGWATAALIANGCEKAWMKAHEAGRGPYYESPVGGKEGERDQRLSLRYRHLKGMPVDDVEDRRFVAVSPAARLHWAIGVLGEEVDVERMREGGMG